MSRRCRYGCNCHRHQQGTCRFYHSPPPPLRNDRSRSRDRNITLALNDCKESENDHDRIELQFMTHNSDTAKWGNMAVNRTDKGLQMMAVSDVPSRIGRCCLVAGKYYYEVTILSAECNARLGWANHSVQIDDVADVRVGSRGNGWSYNGCGDGTKFHDCSRENYGREWKVNDVVSCAVDIDQRTIQYYLNGRDLGMAFTNVNFDQGVAPCVSVVQGHNILLVTQKQKFKFKMPAGYSEIFSDCKSLIMTWPRVINQVQSIMGARMANLVQDTQARDIDQGKIHSIVQKLTMLTETERQALEQVMMTEWNAVPVIGNEQGMNVKQILENRGFQPRHVDRALQENQHVVYASVTEAVLNSLVTKCAEYEAKEYQQIHVKNWKNWSCLEVIEWVESLNAGHFKSDKYLCFKNMLKMMKVDGPQLETVYDLNLKLLTLHDKDDRILIIKCVDELTERKSMRQLHLEPPKEYCDPISLHLMDDPVICFQSGYTYDRVSISNIIRCNGQDPFTRQAITAQDLVPNRLIKDCIDKWKKENQ